jgi:hypothetical protein
MAQTPAQRRSAQRRLARDLRENRSSIPEARYYRQTVRRNRPPIQGGNEGGDGGWHGTLDQLADAIGRKICDSSPNGIFSGLPKYSRKTVRYMLGRMSSYQRDVAYRISSGDYRMRASGGGVFNHWWYHSQNLSRFDEAN